MIFLCLHLWPCSFYQIFPHGNIDLLACNLLQCVLFSLRNKPTSFCAKHQVLFSSVRGPHLVTKTRVLMSTLDFQNGRPSAVGDEVVSSILRSVNQGTALKNQLSVLVVRQRLRQVAQVLKVMSVAKTGDAYYMIHASSLSLKTQISKRRYSQSCNRENPVLHVPCSA